MHYCPECGEACGGSDEDELCGPCRDDLIGDDRDDLDDDPEWEG